MMKKTIVLIACAAGLLCGCASSGGVPHLSDERAQKLVTAADQMAMVGGVVPDAIENLDPIQVYADHGNIVIAMQRNAQGEKGFYIMPTTSSFDPRFSSRPDWTFSLVNPSDPYLDNLYLYTRK
jgi:hypothetical protein